MIYATLDRLSEENILKRDKKILARYHKLMSEFKWTDENMQKIFALNDFIMQKERELYDNAVKIRNDLENHVKNGYYKTYDFEINIIYEPDHEECSPIADEETFWDLYYSTDHSYTEHILPSGDEIQPFEEMFSRNKNYNGYDCFQNCPDKSHYLCEYLPLLIDKNASYTLQDLLYMKPKHFCTVYSIHANCL